MSNLSSYPDFDRENFPPHADPSNEETGEAELYPESLQDQTNELYNHNKVLPRVEGKDYNKSKVGYDAPEGVTLEKGQ